MKEFNYKDHVYMFAEDVVQPKEGLYMAVLTSSDNERCELIFKNGELHRLTILED